LGDSNFLKFAHYMTGSFIGKINDRKACEWYKELANTVIKSQYRFTSGGLFGAKGEDLGTKKIKLVNKRDKILEKALSLILELVYEKGALFLEESHGYRPERSRHTALYQIKYRWKAIPYYIQLLMIKEFDDINRNVLINDIKEKICDKRFTDLFYQMYKCDILCPEGFWIRKKTRYSFV